jgi:hypothetical protein
LIILNASYGGTGSVDGGPGPPSPSLNINIYFIYIFVFYGVNRINSTKNRPFEISTPKVGRFDQYGKSHKRI